MRGRYKKKKITEATLAAIPFFKGLDKAELAEILRLCEGREYPANGAIIDPGEPGDDVFFIVSGSTSAAFLLGKTPVSLQVLRAGAMFGELAALDHGPRTTHVVARESTFVIRMAGPSFRQVALGHKLLAERTIERVCSLSRYLCELCCVVLQFNVRSRVFYVFYQEVQSANPGVEPLTIKPAPTNNELGERCGTNRSQVNRTLKELRELGLLETGNRIWHLPDPQKLLEYLRSVLGSLPGDN